MTATKTKPWSVKTVFFSIRDAIAYRGVRDPAASWVTGGGDSAIPLDATPRVDAALQLSTVFACVRLIAETISTLPLFLYERAANGDRLLAREHPLYPILHDQPNADMTAVEFWEAVVSQLCLWGNAFCRIGRVAGEVRALDPLNPAWMVVKRQKNGAPLYIYNGPGGRVEYTENDIWHVKGFGTDGLLGLSPVGVGTRSIRGAANVENASAAMFGKGMKPDAVITTKELLTRDQRQQMKEKFADGLFTAGDKRTMLIEAAEYKQLTMDPQDAQMLESRQFSVEDLCRWFQVNPSMIGHGTAVSNWGTGREQIMLSFITFTLLPYLTRIQQGVRKSLLRPEERTKYYAEHSVEGLLRADSAGRAALYASAAQNGWMTRNEIRTLENLPRVAGGDELTVQSNLIPVTLLGKITNTAQNAKAALLEWLGIKEKDDETQGQ